MFKNFYLTKQEFKTCEVLLGSQVLKAFILKEVYVRISFYILDAFLKNVRKLYFYKQNSWVLYKQNESRETDYLRDSW